MDKCSAERLVYEALQGKYIGTPYNKIDCQALVENILRDAGVTNPKTGKMWNWRGSNHMWREAVTDRHTINERDPVPGEWVFTIKNDGGEKARGYHDNMGNAAHVGIYLGDGIVQHSTTGGVQWDNITSKRWTHAARVLVVDYSAGPTPGAGCECWRCKIRDRCRGGYADVAD